MKKLNSFLILVFLISLTTVLSPAFGESDIPLAQDWDSWSCLAHGAQRFDPPGPTIWQTVIGYGPTEFDAMSRALDLCRSQGLQMCSVGSCYKR